METAVCSLRTRARLHTVDYHGHTQTQGGDPVTAKVIDQGGVEATEVRVEDCQDGTYQISFTREPSVSR